MEMGGYVSVAEMGGMCCGNVGYVSVAKRYLCCGNVGYASVAEMGVWGIRVVEMWGMCQLQKWGYVLWKCGVCISCRNGGMYQLCKCGVCAAEMGVCISFRNGGDAELGSMFCRNGIQALDMCQVKLKRVMSCDRDYHNYLMVVM